MLGNFDLVINIVAVLDGVADPVFHESMQAEGVRRRFYFSLDSNFYAYAADTGKGQLYQSVRLITRAW